PLAGLFAKPADRSTPKPAVAFQDGLEARALPGFLDEDLVDGLAQRLAERAGERPDDDALSADLVQYVALRTRKVLRPAVEVASARFIDQALLRLRHGIPGARPDPEREEIGLDVDPGIVVDRG